MLRALILSAALVCAATPVLAASSVCSTAPASKWQPKSTLEKQLKAEGMNVRQIKSENGCYEVYAIDKTGKKVNVAYDAQTLKMVADPEAGEK